MRFRSSRVHVLALLIVASGVFGVPARATQDEANDEATLRDLQETRAFWSDKAARLRVATADPRFDRWLAWVAIQPTLRRIHGCSFLPYHDYGRGGRGWRGAGSGCGAGSRGRARCPLPAGRRAPR